LQCDEINLLFAKHGLPQIAVRWTPEDLPKPSVTAQYGGLAKPAEVTVSACRN
jgi:hypothetical protein